MTMRQYAIDRLEVSWAGLDLKEGAAAGTFLQEARTSQRFSTKPSGTGSLFRAFNPDESGIVTIMVDQESKTHQQLLAISDADQNLRNAVFPMFCHDASNAEKWSYANAFILSPPNESRGVESTTFQWQFAYERRVKLPALNDANVVGS